jgi:hypothetical protein
MELHSEAAMVQGTHVGYSLFSLLMICIIVSPEVGISTLVIGQLHMNDSKLGHAGFRPFYFIYVYLIA